MREPTNHWQEVNGKYNLRITPKLGGSHADSISRQMQSICSNFWRCRSGQSAYILILTNQNFLWGQSQTEEKLMAVESK